MDLTKMATCSVLLVPSKEELGQGRKCEEEEKWRGGLLKLLNFSQVHTCTRRKVTVTNGRGGRGNGTIPGIQGPRHKEKGGGRSQYAQYVEREPRSCPCTYTGVSHKHCTRHKRSPKYMERMEELTSTRWAHGEFKIFTHSRRLRKHAHTHPSFRIVTYRCCTL